MTQIQNQFRQRSVHHICSIQGIPIFQTSNCVVFFKIHNSVFILFCHMNFDLLTLCWKKDPNKQIYQKVSGKIRATVAEGKLLPCLTANVMSNRLRRALHPEHDFHNIVVYHHHFKKEHKGKKLLSVFLLLSYLCILEINSLSVIHLLLFSPILKASFSPFLQFLLLC